MATSTSWPAEGTGWAATSAHTMAAARNPFLLFIVTLSVSLAMFSSGSTSGRISGVGLNGTSGLTPYCPITTGPTGAVIVIDVAIVTAGALPVPGNARYSPMTTDPGYHGRSSVCSSTSTDSG